MQLKKQVCPQNSNLYAYAANNPVKYTDLDGKANVYSYKYSKNKYGFVTDFDTTQGAVRSLYGIIPFIGDAIYEGIQNLLGFKTINKKDAYTRILAVSSPILDTVSCIKYVADYAKITGSLAKAAGTIAKVAGVIGDLVTAGDFIYQITRKQEVAVNYLIDILLDDSLCSNSHENVSALYYYAKTRILDLIKNDKLNYEAEWDGTPKWFSYKREEINQLKEELKLLNKLLQEEN